MKPLLETAYLTSKSLSLLALFPAGALFWVGFVAVLVGTPEQKLIGAAAVVTGAAIYALVVKWFGSLARNGPEVTYSGGTFVAADTYQERRRRR